MGYQRKGIYGWIVERNAEVGAIPQVSEKIGGSSYYKNCGIGWLFLGKIDKIEEDNEN